MHRFVVSQVNSIYHMYQYEATLNGMKYRRSYCTYVPCPSLHGPYLHGSYLHDPYLHGSYLHDPFLNVS